MATAEGVRAAFAKLHSAGYRMPKDATPSGLLASWLEVFDGISDASMAKAVWGYVNSDETFWPVPGTIRTKITGGYRPTTYWDEHDDGEVAPPGNLWDALRAEGLDVDGEREAFKRRDAVRRAQTRE